jgi:spore germination cell wall hydrolase CwlJ-like protein
MLKQGMNIGKILLCVALLVFSANLNILYEIELIPVNYVLDRQQEKEKQCVVEALHQEARGEGKEGLEAVLSVIYNRKHHKAFPSTFCKVIDQPKQFSYKNHLVQGQRIKVEFKPSEKEVQKEIHELAEKAVTGRFKPMFDRSVLWYHTYKVKPKWSRKMQKVAVVGNHKFFEEKIDPRVNRKEKES